MSRGIGKLQRQIIQIMTRHQSEGVTNTRAPGGAYSTHVSMLHSLLEFNGENPATFKRKVRRALQSLADRGMIRRERDGSRSWCVMTPELEDMRRRRDEEFEELFAKMKSRKKRR
jgi:hypothetical protein